jgi:pimeloyl-ACP methyl ester carboxylesterase
MSSHDEAVDITVDGRHIEGTVIVPAIRRENGPAAVLFVHGWGGSQEQYRARARLVAALGCVCLTFDLRGHERTLPQLEVVTREDNLRDVIAAYDVLASRDGVDCSRIALVGSSYGAYLGAIATMLRPVRWLSLRAPALYKDAGWDSPKRALHRDPDFIEFRRRAHRPADNRALDACARFRGHALVVESQNDGIVPHAVVASYVAAFSGAHSLTHRVIEGADHGLSREPWKQAYTELLVRWFKEMTTSAAVEPSRALAAAAPRAPEES